ncbi:MAG: site-specific integrase [Cuniculiplasma sp.]
MEPIIIEYMDPKKETDRPNVIQMSSRILRPDEYMKLRAVAKPSYRTLFDAALLTGMRIVELKMFLDHPEWFDGTFIHLPRVAIKKQKATVTQRWVHLSIKGRTIIESLHRSINVSNIPTEQGLIQYLKECAKRSGIGSHGINMKMFRKTYESWLICSYPERKEEIFLSQGHNSLTALRHYVNLPFTEIDREGMKEFVDGWK